jgi:hypothetical protein
MSTSLKTHTPTMHDFQLRAVLDQNYHDPIFCVIWLLMKIATAVQHSITPYFRRIFYHLNSTFFSQCAQKLIEHAPYMLIFF